MIVLCRPPPYWTLCTITPLPPVNPLSPNIHLQILHTDLYTFPLKISWENLKKDHGIFTLVIILLILITFSFDNVWIFLGENWCWSPLGLNGLMNTSLMAIYLSHQDGCCGEVWQNVWKKKKVLWLVRFSSICCSTVNPSHF